MFCFQVLLSKANHRTVRYGRNKRKSRACVFTGRQSGYFLLCRIVCNISNNNPPSSGELYLQAAGSLRNNEDTDAPALPSDGFSLGNDEVLGILYCPPEAVPYFPHHPSFIDIASSKTPNFDLCLQEPSQRLWRPAN